ncbi:hypothetical protein [Paenibacillus gansuensis]|uniref:Uncharacterized protein n=1 Tax=Paenibacillus gansuensis TaxID=306542 RepID=A0ABW5P969_9BACL
MKPVSDQETLPHTRLPYHLLHNVLTGLGYSHGQDEEAFTYRYVLSDESSSGETVLLLPYHMSADDRTASVEWVNAAVTAGKAEQELRTEASAKLHETAEVLRRKLEDWEKMQQSNNSSMAQNEKEMIRLGKDMEGMKTNGELRERGVVPDPIQS